jgi:RNA polymerase sigma-70 factor (ECF subfamily)
VSAIHDSVSAQRASPDRDRDRDRDEALDDEAQPTDEGARETPTPVSGVKLMADRERAFRALYEANAAFVWRNLRRLGVADADVEDKLQEVFVVAHRRWREFIDRGHGPRAWLFQIALRVASDARRHRRRHPVDPDGGAAQDLQTVEAPQAAAIDQRQALDLLDRALANIDLARRAVVVLHEIEQMTAPEIARTLDVPLNTVYSRLRVGRIELEEELRQLQDMHTGARANANANANANQGRRA